MPTDPNQIAAVVENAVESAIPALAPFAPLIALVRTAIVAHFNATQTFPTEAEIMAAVPADWQKLQQTWQGWKPSGDGTLKR
jgi:hypothetical protein